MAAFTRESDGGFSVALPSDLRTLLQDLCGQLREVLLDGDRAADPALARLFPAAYEDPLRELDFERSAGDALLAARLADLDTVETGVADAERLTEDQLLAWLRVMNDLRLVLGSRLDVTEASTEEDFAADEDAANAFELYAVLGWLESSVLEALDPGLHEPDIEDVERGAIDPDG